MSDPHRRFFSGWSKFYESTPLFTRLLRGQQDEAMRRLAPARGERVLDLGCGTGRALLCTNSFHHHPDAMAALREMRRVLAPGGRAVLVDPNLDHPLARLTIYGGEALVFGMSVHLHSTREWEAMCREAGFSRATAEPLRFTPFGAVSLCIECAC